jgi:hypothetical protein
MGRKLLMLGGVALALLMVSAASNPADARRGGHRFHGGGHGGHFHARPHFRHFHGHRHFHRHRGIYLGAPFLYGGYYYYGDYYGGDCYWLRRRALYTGSRYWWNRYRACIYGY